METADILHGLAMAWWLGFVTVLGLCIGSFTNVLVYRLPLGRGLTEPLWSACPLCQARIRWYDNLPVLSFIRLGGRCRHCRRPIARRYPIVEIAVAFVFLAVFDALVVGQLRGGLNERLFISDRVLADWPILTAHLVLFACLFAMSAIDLEHYWVDVRFTNAVTGVGFVLHALWTPDYSERWIRPGLTTAWASLAGLLGLAAVWLVAVSIPWRESVEEYEEDGGAGAPDGGAGTEASAEAAAMASEDGAVYGDRGRSAKEALPDGRGSAQAASRRWVWLLVAVLVVTLIAIAANWPTALPGGAALRPLPLIAVFFILIVACSGVQRASDDTIVEAIEEESGGARAVALAEGAAFLVPVLFAATAAWWLWRDPAAAERAARALHWEVRVSSAEAWRHWQPVYGLATAASGYMIAGALGWAVRIVFTLVFGREAMGVGDIHLMAAAGCVAGWPVVVLGFFLACFFAIFGWLINLPRKRSRAIPLGPWLAIGFLTVAVYLDRLTAWGPVAGVIRAGRLLISGNSQDLSFEPIP